ncbi:MAG: hypothetical protein IKI16_05420 [Prevotella sp.]|nr:hypothetical protein [Prevotella sp.]
MKKFFYSVLAVVFAALTFTSCDDVPMPYAQPEVNGGGQTYEGAEGDGTLENPYNVAGVLQFISGLEPGVETEDNVYIKGTISSIEEEYGETYGNAKYYITDPGTDYTFYVFQSYYLNNKKWKKGDTQIKLNDEVIVCGKVVNYKGTTPETVINKSYLYSLNGQGGGGDTPGQPSGEGTEASPFNVAAAVAKCKEIGTETPTENSPKYYVKGIVVADASVNTQYNNITFEMTDADNEGGEYFKAFQVTVLNGMDGVKKGDEVVVYGPIYNYSGNTPETAGKSAAKIVSYKNNSGSDTGGDTGGDTGANMTKSVDATNYIVTFTNSSATAGESVTYDLTTCGLTHQTENPSFTMNGANFVFATNGGKNTPKYWHDDEGKFNEFRMYALNTLTITGTANIAAVSFQCSPDYNGTKYTGNDDAFGTVNGKTFTFTNQWSSNSGGTQLRITKVTITYAK